MAERAGASPPACVRCEAAKMDVVAVVALREIEIVLSTMADVVVGAGRPEGGPDVVMKSQRPRHSGAYAETPGPITMSLIVMEAVRRGTPRYTTHACTMWDLVCRIPHRDRVCRIPCLSPPPDKHPSAREGAWL